MWRGLALAARHDLALALLADLGLRRLLQRLSLPPRIRPHRLVPARSDSNASHCCSSIRWFVDYIRMSGIAAVLHAACVLQSLFCRYDSSRSRIVLARRCTPEHLLSCAAACRMRFRALSAVMIPRESCFRFVACSL